MGKDARRCVAPAGTSLALIRDLAVPSESPILDVGGGTSRLADELVRLGYTGVAVAEPSNGAIAGAKARIGNEASSISWIRADARRHDFDRRYAVWHDNGLLHTLTKVPDIDAYLATLRTALAPGGYVVLATFTACGPRRCCGLSIHSYHLGALEGLLGPEFVFERALLRWHETPEAGSAEWLHVAARRTGGP
jgi:SAM-dependent methyltransferase